MIPKRRHYSAYCSILLVSDKKYSGVKYPRGKKNHPNMKVSEDLKASEDEKVSEADKTCQAFLLRLKNVMMDFGGHKPSILEVVIASCILLFIFRLGKRCSFRLPVPALFGRLVPNKNLGNLCLNVMTNHRANIYQKQ